MMYVHHNTVYNVYSALQRERNFYRLLTTVSLNITKIWMHCRRK